MLGAHFRIGVVVKLQVTHRGEEHGIGSLTNFIRFLGEGIAHGINGSTTHKGGLQGEFVPKLLGYGFKHRHTLCGDFGTYAVAGEDGYVEGHNFKGYKGLRL